MLAAENLNPCGERRVSEAEQAREQRGERRQHRHGVRALSTATSVPMVFATTNERTARDGSGLLLMAHDFERIGDRMTNICEDIVYLVTGQIEKLN